MAGVITSDNGSWYYVSNAEVSRDNVGSMEFDAKGNVVGYQMVLKGTSVNCGGGRTPWNTWISGEEHSSGRLWQVDPNGLRPAQPLTMGSGGDKDKFESFLLTTRGQVFRMRKWTLLMVLYSNGFRTIPPATGMSCIERVLQRT